MAVPAQVPSQSYVAAAGQTVFAFNFRVDDSTTVQVFKNLVQQGGFTVALNSDQVGAPGGSVTLAAGALLNDAIIVKRATPLSSSFSITAYTRFTALALTAAIDRIVEMIQELSVGLGVTPATVVVTPVGLLTKYEVPAGAVNGTTGSNGNAAFTLVNQPVSATYLDVFVDGIRQDPARYALVTKTITFAAPFIPTTGSTVYADYYH